MYKYSYCITFNSARCQNIQRGIRDTSRYTMGVEWSLDGVAEPERTQLDCVAKNLGRATETRPSIQRSYRGELHNVSVRYGSIQAKLLCAVRIVCACARATVKHECQATA